VTPVLLPHAPTVPVSWETLTRLIMDAAGRGELLLPPSPPISVSIAGSCTAPFQTILVAQMPGPEFRWNREKWEPSYREWRRLRDVYPYSVPRRRHDVRLYSPHITRPFYADLYVPCRSCEACLDLRKRQWQARACAEFDNSERTWFLTLTLKPEARFYASLNGGYKVFLNREWTLLLKRLRKTLGLPFRYLSVLEEHKDGVLHLHALIHDLSGLLPKAALRSQWVHGITHCKLADKQTCFYISKYLLKQTSGRVRSSQKYGDPKGIVSKKKRVSVIGDLPSQSLTPIFNSCSHDADCWLRF